MADRQVRRDARQRTRANRFSKIAAASAIAPLVAGGATAYSKRSGRICRPMWIMLQAKALTSETMAATEKAVESGIEDQDGVVPFEVTIQKGNARKVKANDTNQGRFS
jgi:hypothetical protein